MKKANYGYIANNLLGDELYCKFIKEIAKENKGGNLVDYGNRVFEKCCALIVSIGMSKTIKMDKIGLCVGSEVIEINCKEFYEKYNEYIKEIKKRKLVVIDGGKA